MTPDEQYFEVTEEHIALLSHAIVDYDDWTEFGAPEINPKRPYGNSGVYEDVAEILELSPTDFLELEEILKLEEGELPEEMYDYIDRVHKETATALQIFLSTGTMEPGLYKSNWYGRNWTKVK